MDEQTILNAVDPGETRDWEFKSALGGVPKSMWETYSAMANARIREVTAEHPADLTKRLQGLVAGQFLEQVGQKRGSFYRLPSAVREGIDQGSSHLQGDSSQLPTYSSHLAGNSPRLTGDSPRLKEDSPQIAEPLTEVEVTRLRGIAEPALAKRKLPTNEMQRVVLLLCEGRYLTATTLGSLLRRNPNGLRDRLLTPMVEDGLLTRRYPGEPNRPDQAYTSAKREGSTT